MLKVEKIILSGLWGLFFVSAAANALSVSGQAGQHYTNLGVGFGTESTGLVMSGDWAHSDNDGDVAGIGVGLNVPLGPFIVTVGGKGVYTNPEQGNEGYAVATGGALQWQIGQSVRLFAEYYYSPDSLSSGIENYEAANIGGRWIIMQPVSVEAGYRYINLADKGNNRDNTIADGPYVGVSAAF
ncbi:YfaZ family outer membrane protein [Citrobacter portucalensis]|uniref:YfaZ family outer membrane protein n=1 Tax=Citrobacter portucalensis TaxID=1639133 RepID=UPI001828BF47|nr:hypothetical protein [Salmonella enterica]